MKNMGRRSGSGAWAKPVIVSGDTVYVHSNIQQVTEHPDGTAADDLWEYDEVQYSVQEYVELIGHENSDLKTNLESVSSELTDTQMALVDVYEMIGGLL